MMESQFFQPIETPLGTLNGRDAIFLDKMDVQIDKGVIVLEGDFIGRLASIPQDREIHYMLTFFGVYAFKVIGLDSWDCNSASSFDEVVNSEWYAKLSGEELQSHKPDQPYKHYLIQTYDDVIDIICRKFALSIKAE